MKHVLRSTIVLFAVLVFVAGCGSDASSSSNNGTWDAGDSSGTDTRSTDTATDTASDASSGDVSDTRTNLDTGGGEDAQGGDDLYVGASDPYAQGALSVTVTDIAAEQAGAPVPMQVYEPQQPGRYGVVVFQHGFQMQNVYYSTILERLASHGFVVIAPQMTGGSLFDSPSAGEEADEAKTVYAWLETNLAAQISVTPSFDHVGLIGHSRGAKVIWLVMSNDASFADALAGVDPVDGTGGPLGGEERVIDGQFAFSPPVFILGTGLGPEENFGQACAPTGDNHEQFYSASPSPAWHLVATEHGHLDMLDDETPRCGAACTLCPSGEDKSTMRALTAGTLVAFFRGSLQGDDTAYQILSDVQSAPTDIDIDEK
jgi:chlorophyllase